MNTTSDKINETLLPASRQLTSLSCDYPLNASCMIVCKTPTDSFAGERFADLINEEWGFCLPVLTKKFADKLYYKVCVFYESCIKQETLTNNQTFTNFIGRKTRNTNQGDMI